MYKPAKDRIAAGRLRQQLRALHVHVPVLLVAVLRFAEAGREVEDVMDTLCRSVHRSGRTRPRRTSLPVRRQDPSRLDEGRATARTVAPPARSFSTSRRPVNPVAPVTSTGPADRNSPA